MKPPYEQEISDLKSRNEALEGRVQALEEEMTTCLSWMRIHAEREAAKVDPTFKGRPGPQA